jgi:hypothetical protein
MIQSDTNGAMLQIMRNLVDTGPAGKPPVSVFASTLGDVTAVDTGDSCALRQTISVPILEHTVTSLSDFLTDKTNRNTAIRTLVGTLAHN